MYLTGVAELYPSMNVGYLRSHVVLDEDWLELRYAAADKAFRAVEALIAEEKLELQSCHDNDKSYDSDGNTVSSVASYIQEKPKKTHFDEHDRQFFNCLPSCFVFYFVFNTRDVSKSYCPFAKFNHSW
jgi:hypothetical protein